jgi:hypothetical protein
MFEAASVPKEMPEPGFYYHKKHDPAGGITDHAYEVMGVGYHTETGEYTVTYRPLYRASFSYENGLFAYNRPLEMFMDSAEVDSVEVRRFTRITDLDLVHELYAVRDEMYPSE